ncbi:MAG: hypothetical protein JST26_09620 [Bacteroidetes bacterium]|nr:hypothetical protein [Bacteroidota bacterium]
MRANKKPAAKQRVLNQQIYTPLNSNDILRARRFLSPREWQAFILYYNMLDYDATAALMGIGRKACQYLVKSSLEKLRYYFEMKRGS